MAAKPSPYPGEIDAESQPLFFRSEPPLNHGQHRSPHACGSNTHKSIKEAGGPKLLDGAHKENADAQDEAAGGDDAAGRPICL